VVVTTPDESRPATAGYRQARFFAPPGATDLLLIRHGESQKAYPDRPFPMLDGHSDPDLAPAGRDQAQRVAARVAAEHVDAIYSSGLRRTEQTAAPLAARLGLTPGAEPGLREVKLGIWEAGLFRKMVAEHHPIAMRMWAEERWDVIPDAEPAEDFAARVRAGIERLAAAHPDQRLAVFVHGGVIGQILALASGSRRFAFIGADNGSISRLVVSGEQWMVRSFNDTAHLNPALRLAPAAGRGVTPGGGG
jgi:2,3-bisphosphoglycerate-dependent phosphoglycerate mutase